MKAKFHTHGINWHDNLYTFMWIKQVDGRRHLRQESRNIGDRRCSVFIRVDVFFSLFMRMNMNLIASLKLHCLLFVSLLIY